MATKTIKEWFEILKEPYKTQAINNTDEGILILEVGSLWDALVSAFDWEHTEEGTCYWKKLSTTSENLGL